MTPRLPSHHEPSAEQKFGLHIADESGDQESDADRQTDLLGQQDGGRNADVGVQIWK